MLLIKKFLLLGGAAILTALGAVQPSKIISPVNKPGVKMTTSTVKASLKSKAKPVRKVAPKKITPRTVKPPVKKPVTAPPAPTPKPKPTSPLPISVSEKPLQSVVTPGPLTVSAPARGQTQDLTIGGIVVYTNKARTDNGGLPNLTNNEILNKVAWERANDMFKKQYFAHDSPDGVKPADVADRLGYEYITFGENIALGDFADDEDLVTAWMNSPGHRANILTAKYQEIGVAAATGTYDGRVTWIAVQVFGKPRASCPEVDKTLAANIDKGKTEISVLQNRADNKRAELQTLAATADTEEEINIYNQKINDYNALVKQVNALVAELRDMIDKYNAEARAFNACSQG